MNKLHKIDDCFYPCRISLHATLVSIATWFGPMPDGKVTPLIVLTYQTASFSGRRNSSSTESSVPTCPEPRIWSMNCVIKTPKYRPL